MIPLTLDDPVVLRRTLEEIEAGQLVVATSISSIDVLTDAADLAEVVVKLNEVILGFNTVVALLNATNTSDRP